MVIIHQMLLWIVGVLHHLLFQEMGMDMDTDMGTDTDNTNKICIMDNITVVIHYNINKNYINNIQMIAITIINGETHHMVAVMEMEV